MKIVVTDEVIGIAADISTRDEFAHVESPLILRIVEEAAKSFAQALGEPVAVPDDGDELMCCNGQDCGCQGVTMNQYRAFLVAQERTAVTDQLMIDLYRSASKGFHTSESCGPDGKYEHVSKFQSLADLHAFTDAWTKAMLSAQPI
jgi:hypothetical protein